MSFLRCLVLLTAFFAPPVLGSDDLLDEIANHLTMPHIKSPLTDTSHFVEDDILRPFEDEDGLQARGGIFRYARLWPFNASSGHYDIPYELADEYTADQKATILHAFEFISRGSNVRMVPRESKDITDYLSIADHYVCGSEIGRVGGPQQISLGPACLRLGPVVVQIFHALGLVSEHRRVDRDSFVEIRWKYIAEGHNSSFEISPYSDGGVCSPYDYASIMHGRAWAFHKDGATGTDEITILPYYMAGKIPLLSDIMAPSSCDWFEVNLLYPINGRRFKCVPHQMPPTAFPRPDCVSPISKYTCEEYCIRYPYDSPCQLPESGFPDLPPNHPNGITSGVFDPSICGMVVQDDVGFLHSARSDA